MNFSKLHRMAGHTGRKVVLALMLLHTSPLQASQQPVAAAASTFMNNGQLLLQGVPEIPPGVIARVHQYQNVRSAAFLDWTEDGNGMYIRTRFSLVDQVHRVDFPGGSRQQLTFFEDPIGEVIRQNQGSTLALTMDRGGSEFNQVFLLDPDSAVATMVSDGSSRNTHILWDKSGARLAYLSTRRNGRSNDIWLMDIAHSESARAVLESPDDSLWVPVDFTEDGNSLLVQQVLSAADSRVYLLDLASAQRRILAGSEAAPSANRAVVLDRKNEGFYLVSNARGVGAELAWQSLLPGSEAQYISGDITWDVSEFALSPDGRRGAFITNEDGTSQLYLLNTGSQRFSLVSNMPPGVISHLSFNQDNRRLAMTLSTAQTPNDVFVMELGKSPEVAKSLQRWTISEVGGLDTGKFVVPRLVRYPTFDEDQGAQRQIPAFVYQPPGAGPFPVIITVHGGPESQYRPGFSGTAQMWVAELGAAVIAPNVRGSLGYGMDYLSLDDGYKREDAVKDIGALLDWIATQPQFDANRVVVHGASYGGYMALAAAARYGSRLRAAVNVVGISNFVTFLESTQDYRRDLRRVEYGDERDPEMRAFLHGISPLSQVDSITLPLLVVQGQNDPRVPVTEAEQIVAALRQQGNPVWYINALNEGHGYDRKENRDVYQQAAMMFLQRYLIE
jgi:dipeptidyl aminopeptidase/acylaminoacyl peptidase